MTLVEVLVGMSLLSVLGTLLLGLALSTGTIADSTKRGVDINEESRVALERLSRELRQARAVTAIEPASDEFIGIRFEADFNGDNVINGPAAPTPTMVTETGPEILSYRWNSTTRELTLTDGSVFPPITEPVLAAEVIDFDVQLWSSRWEPIPADPSRGTSWAELEAGTPPDSGWWSPTQLADVDRVTVTMTASLGGAERSYSTDVSLRNAQVLGEHAVAP